MDTYPSFVEKMANLETVSSNEWTKDRVHGKFRPATHPGLKLTSNSSAFTEDHPMAAL